MFLVSCIMAISTFKAQNIYSKAYGEEGKPALIYIHGGPRGNSTLFESTTAQDLSQKGFYVIVYDRSGEGRSTDSTAKFTYKESINDLNSLYKKYHLKNASLIAHSFGGLVGTLFTKKHPNKVKNLVLVGGLFSQQDTYNHILETSRKIAQEKNDAKMFQWIQNVEQLPHNSADYRKQCYKIASENKYFSMPEPTEQSIALRKKYEESDFGKNNIRYDNAPLLFYKNEKNNNINTKNILQNLTKKVTIYALYGKQDGIFSDKQHSELKTIVGSNHFKLIENCSHYPFVDQQKEFISTLEKWLK